MQLGCQVDSKYAVGFCVIAPDMPGCGSSVGHAMINNGIHRSAR